MRLKEKTRLNKAVKVMRVLNKMQLQTKELRKNLDKIHPVIDENYIKGIEKSIYECSIQSVDVIGDTVYFDFLKKNKIKTIAEPHQMGWYLVHGDKK